MTSRPKELVVRAIGVIRSPFREMRGTPIQGVYGEGAEGEVIVEDEHEAALDDLEGFDRIWLLYWCDRAGAPRPRVVPYRDTVERGLFATRAPSRPNPIGLSAVRLVAREGPRLVVAGIDVLDGTPLLDIKPYVPRFDAFADARAGWLDDDAVDRRRADGRFRSS